MKVSATIAALGLMTVSAAADVQVRPGRGRTHVEARAAPLSEVLDGLAEQTGMKIVYEGAPPRQPITTTLDRGMSAEALLAVLEGLGLSYAARLDPTRTRIVTLVMVASNAGRPSTGGAAPAAPTAEPLPEVVDSEVEEFVEEPAGETHHPLAALHDRLAIDPNTGEAFPPPTEFRQPQVEPPEVSPPPPPSVRPD